MADVYSNSYLNIAAAGGADGRGGCFSERDPSLVCPIRIYLAWGPSSGYYYAAASHAFPRSVLLAPLHQRAWVTQERLLSPRNIQCGPMQLYWDCCELIASESFPQELPRGSWYGLRGSESNKVIWPAEQQTLGASPRAPLKIYAIWDRIVSNYSSCDLTFATDKLVALSSVAAKISKYTDSQYLAGIWRNHLAYQLLWVATPRASTGYWNGYTAPSWSWASSPNPVFQPSRVWFADDHEIMIDVIEARTELLDKRHPFGEVTGGFLRLGGVLLGNIDKLTLTPDDGTGGTAHPWLRINGLVLYRPEMDLVDYQENPQGKSLFYLPVRHASTLHDFEVPEPDISGLVLEPFTSRQDTFRRVGVFEIHTGGYWFYDDGALEAFRGAFWSHNGLSDGGPFSDWGKRRAFTVL